VHGTVGAVLNGSEHVTSAQIGSLDGGALYTFIVAECALYTFIVAECFSG